jgi:hypothetical protein
MPCSIGNHPLTLRVKSNTSSLGESRRLSKIRHLFPMDWLREQGYLYGRANRRRADMIDSPGAHPWQALCRSHHVPVVPAKLG